MILPFWGVVPTFKVRDSNYIWEVDAKRQVSTYLQFVDKYNLAEYGRTDLTDDEIKKIDQIRFLEMVEKFYQDDLQMVPYTNWMICSESQNLGEAKEAIKKHLSGSKELYDFIFRYEDLQEAFRGDFKANFQFYKSVIGIIDKSRITDSAMRDLIKTL